jgi:hypothetical protein
VYSDYKYTLWGIGEEECRGMSEALKSPRSFVGMALSVAGIACALVGPFLTFGISLEFTGLILGGLGYYFVLKQEDRLGQALGLVALVLCVISVFVSGLTGAPQ